jgi:co-chaperonin GroES (HSP10)
MLYPLNKYLVVEPIEERKTNTGVLVPEDYTVTSAFKLARILQVHENSKLEKGTRIVVPTHMVEEVTFSGETYYLVTENNVVGIHVEKEL